MIRTILFSTALLSILAGCAATTQKPRTTTEQPVEEQNRVMQRDYSAAAGELDRALQKSPGDAKLYLQRGDLLELSGKMREARQNYQAAIESLAAADPLYPEILWRLALLQAGTFDQAAAARQLAERLPKNSHYRHDALGMAALAMGDPEAALDQFNQALKLAEENDQKGWTLYHAALASRKNGDIKNASASLYHAINLGENPALVSRIKELWEQIQATD